MSDGKRIQDIINFIVAIHPTRNITFAGGHGRGLNLSRGSQEQPIRVYDNTLQDLGGKPSSNAVSYEVDGDWFYIDESLIDIPTIPPTSQTVLNFRVIHNIKVDEHENTSTRPIYIREN